MILALAQNVTWIRVERPTFDLVGVILSSLSLAGILAVIAFALGGAFGVFLIRHRRREAFAFADRLSLHLE